MAVHVFHPPMQMDHMMTVCKQPVLLVRLHIVQVVNITEKESTLFEEDNIYRRQINEDIKELLEAIEIVKNHSEIPETIGQALLRLHSLIPIL